MQFTLSELDSLADDARRRPELRRAAAEIVAQRICQAPVLPGALIDFLRMAPNKRQLDRVCDAMRHQGRTEELKTMLAACLRVAARRTVAHCTGARECALVADMLHRYHATPARDRKRKFPLLVHLAEHTPQLRNLAFRTTRSHGST